MRTWRNRPIAARTALALVVVWAGATLVGPAPVEAETANPDYTIQAWYARNKPAPPQVEIPGQGPVSPGDAVPAPQAAEGNFVVSSAGGPPGPEGGDIGWSAFQWDLFDAIGGTVDKFVVTLTQAPDERGDAGEANTQIRACNIKRPFGGAEGANPFTDRPTPDCKTAVAPKVSRSGAFVRYSFDVTKFARTWLDGDGHGLVILPGKPKDPDANLTPFQLTFAGYRNESEQAKQVIPKVRFEYTVADLGAGFGGSTPGGGFNDPITPVDGGGDLAAEPAPSFEPAPSTDVFPDDVGSEGLPSDPAPEAPADDGGGSDEQAAPPTENQPAAAPASTHGKFPAAAWLLLPLALLAFFYTGSALGPAGDPVPVRQGGVSRVLAERRAARAAGELPPIQRSVES